MILRQRSDYGPNERGNEVYGTNDVPFRGIFSPVSSTEGRSNSENVVVATPTVYVLAGDLPDGTTVHPQDAIVIGSIEYEINGDPLVWGPSAFSGWQPGIEIRMRKVSSNG